MRTVRRVTLTGLLLLASAISVQAREPLGASYSVALQEPNAQGFQMQWGQVQAGFGALLRIGGDVPQEGEIAAEGEWAGLRCDVSGAERTRKLFTIVFDCVYRAAPVSQDGYMERFDIQVDLPDRAPVNRRLSLQNNAQVALTVRQL